MPDHSPLHRRGLMFVLSSPSGAGKTTMSRRMLVDDPEIVMSVSRHHAPAAHRRDRGARLFLFVDDAEFDRLRDSDALLEWAKVFGHRYGTPRGPVEDTLHEGRDVLFDIDWQGTQQLQQTDAASGSRPRLHPAADDGRARTPPARTRDRQRGGRAASG